MRQETRVHLKFETAGAVEIKMSSTNLDNLHREAEAILARNEE